jgi:hypothetical protein
LAIEDENRKIENKLDSLIRKTFPAALIEQRINRRILNGRRIFSALNRNL